MCTLSKKIDLYKAILVSVYFYTKHIGDPLLVSKPKQDPLLANVIEMNKANQVLTEVDASKRYGLPTETHQGR